MSATLFVASVFTGSNMGKIINLKLALFFFLVRFCIGIGLLLTTIVFTYFAAFEIELSGAVNQVVFIMMGVLILGFIVLMFDHLLLPHLPEESGDAE
ncbi:hypothetical protein [Rathayibacter sp. AY1F3]|uniref:hypothetical protein n=1 Tax=Rathayibacter sp. AY1F3 TaxID=2080558 RepID=UPI0011B08279|nr:hypothetical protein [Rathayibacter sp. AY1F3]